MSVCPSCDGRRGCDGLCPCTRRRGFFTMRELERMAIADNERRAKNRPFELYEIEFETGKQAAD